ncbi:thioesterase II family protein [Actinopolymorpha pittospori]|uniref:Pyochelin biosynthetic protein PchC n=1 Tax=Actinopolymorpha pittospori TaxID=648752 RepID=A0A927MV63_9ACTN|nr:alpha/beta fold hydrolase [Actinopolymorpha pittospori]MBE1603897.1 pyochelin biosynthetic protein PchC [Actinopolymorpha pittospori]
MLTALNQGVPGSPTVVVFPHAGGSPRFFQHWRTVLPTTTLVGVTYPGRDTRLDESYADNPYGDDLLGLARSAADAISHAGIASPVLVGHSMGAYVAYEVAAALTRAGTTAVRVAVCGQNPPEDRPTTALHLADDADLVADMVRQDPDSAPLWQLDDVRSMFLPAVREDYRLLETYTPTATVVAELLVCHGDRDHEVSPDRLDGWRRHATRFHPPVALSGGHFFLKAPDAQLPRQLTTSFGLS